MRYALLLSALLAAPLEAAPVMALLVSHTTLVEAGDLEAAERARRARCLQYAALDGDEHREQHSGVAPGLASGVTGAGAAFLPAGGFIQRSR